MSISSWLGDVSALIEVTPSATSHLPWSQRFSFAAKRISSDRQRSGERSPLVTRYANLTIMLQ